MRPDLLREGEHIEIAYDPKATVPRQYCAILFSPRDCFVGSKKANGLTPGNALYFLLNMIESENTQSEKQ